MNTATLQTLLPGYSPAELEDLLATGRARAFSPGRWLCREGTVARSCFLLTQGQVEVSRVLDGQERVLATLLPGTFVAPMALIDSAPSSASVRASRPTQALEIRRQAFRKLLAARSPLALRLQEQLAVAGIRQLRAATDRLALVLCDAVRPRGARAPRLDREALARIQAGTSEWEVPLSHAPSGARKV